MSQRDTEVAIHNVSFCSHHWSDHYYSGTSYSLKIGECARLSLTDDMAEKIMLAAGLGEIVWTIDWKKVGQPHAQAIIPRLRQFVAGSIWATRNEAQEAVDKELNNRIEALKTCLGCPHA